MAAGGDPLLTGIAYAVLRSQAHLTARLNAVVSSENAAARPGWVGSAPAALNGIPATR